MKPEIGNEISVSELAECDALGIFSALQSVEIYKFIPEAPPRSVEQVVSKYIKPPVDLGAAYRLLYYTIREGPKIIGLMEVTCWSTGNFEIGFKLNPTSWGKGIGSNALEILIAQLQRRFKIGLVTATVDSRNQGSAAVLKKNGFICTGSEEKVLKMEASISYVFTRNLHK